jgi:hypothetical protein
VVDISEVGPSPTIFASSYIQRSTTSVHMSAIIVALLANKAHAICHAICSTGVYSCMKHVYSLSLEMWILHTFILSGKPVFV